MTYAEYLKANGATDEDIKTLDNAVARKVFEKMQAESEANLNLAKETKQKMTDYEATVAKWHDEVINPQYEQAKKDAMLAKANEARARAVLEQAQKDGLINVSKDMGWDTPATPPANPNVPGFDEKKYYTKEEVLQLARSEAEAIVTVQDISNEHAKLFPDRPINFRDLREEAGRRKAPLEQVWKEKFGVDAARESKARAEQEARDKKIRDEATEAARMEFASKYGNPDTRPLSTSRSPLAARPDTGRDKQPWETGDRSEERVRRATESYLRKSATN